MEPISAIVTALALGAAAAARDIGGEAVKDAYAAVKALIASRYPKVSVDQLERAPQSESRRSVVAEDLQEAKGGNDTELAAMAGRLIDLVQQQAPESAAAIGIDLKDIEAASMRLADVEATGTGVRVEKARIGGAIEITGVRAGVKPG